MELTLRQRSALRLQDSISRMNFVWYAPFMLLLLRVLGGYHCPEARAVRAKVRRILAEAKGRPILICANHLTMIDSFLIAAFLDTPLRYFARFRQFPWNVPELKNFGKNPGLRFMCYISKCVYVERTGSKESRQLTLAKLEYLLRDGHSILIFPEGGRSRTGKVEVENAVYGAGQLLQKVPDALVLAIYLRGEGQETYSFFPRRGERFHMDVEMVTPKTEASGLRGARELTLQVMETLARMEKAYFDRRQ